MQRFTLTLMTALLAFSAGQAAAEDSGQRANAGGLSPADIFQFTNIWTVHLRFTAENWAAMEPRQGPRPQRGWGQGGSFLLGPEGGRNGIAAAFGIVFDYVRADLEFGTNQLRDVGVRVKGNGTFLSSRDSLKRSLKLDFGQFVPGQKFAGLAQLNLHNAVRDSAFMNEAIAYRLFRDGGVPAPRTAYARVFVTVPGQHDRRYLGLYVMTEDVGKAFLQERFGESSGALLKPVTPNLFADLGDDWSRYNQTYDPKGTLTPAQQREIIEFCQFASRASDAEFAAKLTNHFDLDNLARYFALTVWLSDLDGILGPGQNFYLHLHPQTRKFLFIPWDQDQVFGQFPRGTEEQRELLSIQQPWTGENRFLERVYGSKVFQEAYQARMREFNATILRPEHIHRLVEELAGVVREAARAESPERLAELEKAVAGEKIAIAMGPGFAAPPMVKPIKPFVAARWQSVEDQLAGKSEGERITPWPGRPR